MGHQRPNYAAEMDAQTMFREEECVFSMGQRKSNAAKTDAQIRL